MKPEQVLLRLKMLEQLKLPSSRRAIEAAFLKLARDARRYQQLRKKDHYTDICIRNFERLGGAFESLNGVALDRKLDSMYAKQEKKSKAKRVNSTNQP